MLSENQDLKSEIHELKKKAQKLEAKLEAAQQANSGSWIFNIYVCQLNIQISIHLLKFQVDNSTSN